MLHVIDRFDVENYKFKYVKFGKIKGKAKPRII